MTTIFQVINKKIEEIIKSATEGGGVSLWKIKFPEQQREIISMRDFSMLNKI